MVSPLPGKYELLIPATGPPSTRTPFKRTVASSASPPRPHALKPSTPLSRCSSLTKITRVSRNTLHLRHGPSGSARPAAPARLSSAYAPPTTDIQGDVPVYQATLLRVPGRPARPPPGRKGNSEVTLPCPSLRLACTHRDPGDTTRAPFAPLLC